MKTFVWNKFVLWVSLGLLLFLNAYTLVHAVTGPLIFLGILVLLLLFLSAHRFLKGRTEGFADRAAIALWILIPVLQIIFILAVRSELRYDAYWILDQAVEMLDTHQFSSSISSAYFTQVPNNYGLTVITYWFLSILRILGLPSSCFTRAVQFLNMAFLDLALLFIYLSMRKIRGRAAGTLFLFLCALTPYVYVWAPYYYTSTTSMTFACAAVWIWLCVCDSASMVRKCLLAALLGLLCVTGFKVRATSFIAYIAIFLYWSVRHEKGSLRKHARPILAFLLSAFAAFLLWRGIIAHYVPFDTTDTALPVTHFIMMGTQGDGSFNMNDLRYTTSLPTAQEKLSGTLSVIRQRLTENGLSGNIRLLLSKLLNCWADGTDSYITENSLCPVTSRLHTYITGSKSVFLAAYAQMFRSLQLFLVCCFCVISLIRRQSGRMFLLALNLLGGMVFHLFWEASPLYSIAFALFSYALCADSIGLLSGLAEKAPRISSRISAALSLFCLIACGSVLAARFSSTTSQELLLTDYVVNQHMETMGENGPEMKTGQIWTQTFETSAPFNILDLYYGNPGTENNTSVYRIALSDEYGSVFYEGTLEGKDIGPDLYWRIQFPPVIPAASTTYTITIEPLSQDEESYIHFASQDCSRVDLYPSGSLSIDGTDTYRDLSFRVGYLHIGTQATKKEYCLPAILLLLLLFFFLVESLRLVYQERRPVS